MVITISVVVCVPYVCYAFFMKYIISLLVATISLSVAASSFVDVSSSEFHSQAILWAQQNGIVQGYSDGTFRPDAAVNRAEFTKILLEAYAIDSTTLCSTLPFSDAPLEEWYGSYVHKARCDGTIQGYPDGTFRPGNAINIAEAAKIIAKLDAREPLHEESYPLWFQAYVYYLRDHGALPSSIRSMDQSITRGEMVWMIWRLQGGTVTGTPISDTPFQPCSEEPLYLSFQIFTYGALLADRSGEAWDNTSPSPEETVHEISHLLKEVKDSHPCRQLAFSFGPLALDHSDEEMRDVIQRSFSLGRQYDVAISIHIDDSMFWKNREYLHSKVENVEWTDWDRTVHEHRSIGWQKQAELAPSMCYESPEVKAEIRRIARDVIGDEIMKHVEQLCADGKEQRFAGVIAGWETRLEDDTNNPDGSAMHPKPPIGYCSLYHKGFSAENPPLDRDAELNTIVKDHAAHWAKSLHEAGIPTDKIFTHFATGDPDFMETVHGGARNAVNDYSRPGYTLYGDTFHQITSEDMQPLLVDGWINAEGTNKLLGDIFSSDGSDTSLTWETYLGHQYDHGAVMVNLFGWQGGLNTNFGISLREPAATVAYEKFLRGEKMDVEEFIYEPATTVDPVELQERIEAMRSSIQTYLSHGGDLSTVQPLLDDFADVMQTKPVDLDRVLQLLDEIEALVE